MVKEYVEIPKKLWDVIIAYFRKHKPQALKKAIAKYKHRIKIGVRR